MRKMPHLSLTHTGFQLVLLYLSVSDLQLTSACMQVNPGPDNFFTQCASLLPPPCDSKIYCHGPLLYAVQMAKLDRDSKTFVDQKLLRPPKLVIQDFNALVRNITEPTQEMIRKFLKANFGKSRTELQTWEPTDWKASPKLFDRILEPKLRDFAVALNSIWKDLGRQINADVAANPDRYTLIHVPNPFIVPGGRFSEFYYWDQFWIIKGLLATEMYDTARGMIENLLHMVDRYGFVPNGGRIYYLRSQPPMLIPMVQDYVAATKNITFLKTHIKTMEKEFRFWVYNRTTNIKFDGHAYRLAHYDNERTGPRPESFREDYNLALEFPTQDFRDELFVNLKSGAESGWDFSSRWFTVKTLNNRTMSEGLRNIKTRDIVPADLNAMLYNNAKILSKFHRRLKNQKRGNYYEIIAGKWREAINSVLWDDSLGSWFDYDISQQKLRTEFYPSNITPLWAGIYVGNVTISGPHPENLKNPHDYTVDKILKYFQQSGALKFPGGVPTSLEHSGEQWDFPNGWAPLQHFIVEALRNTQHPRAQELAFQIARKWVVNNYETFVNSNNTMFEKYDVQTVGEPGGGGEYEVVTGFGWSNGVILDFLQTYGHRMILPEQHSEIRLQKDYLGSIIV